MSLNLTQPHQLRSGSVILKEGSYTDCSTALIKEIKGTKYKSQLQAISSGKFDIVNPLESQKKRCSDKTFEIIALLESIYVEKQNQDLNLIKPSEIRDILDFIKETHLTRKT